MPNHLACVYVEIGAVPFVGTMMGFGNLGMMMGAGAVISAAIISCVVFMIIEIAGAFIVGAILHIFVFIVGGRRGIAQTIKAVMYGSTPSLLFGLIRVSPRFVRKYTVKGITTIRP